MIYKNRDITTSIENEVEEVDNQNIKFYSEDKGIASLRFFIKFREEKFNLNDQNLIPSLNLFHSDGSIWKDEPLDTDFADVGMVQYFIPDKVMIHPGDVVAKLLLKNDTESIHVSEYRFKIIDSGIEGAIQKEISVPLLQDEVKRLLNDNTDTILGENFKQEAIDNFVNYATANPESFKGPQGEQGEQGLQGEQGPVGEKGVPGDIGKIINRNVVSSGIDTPLITFVDDDGRVEVIPKWEPILKEKGNKLTIPLITQWMDDPNNNSVITWDDVHRLKENYGVEFVSHTHTHAHGNSLTPDQIEYEYTESKRILMREGLTHNIIVQPYGENSADVRRISRKYARANIGTKEGTNNSPFDTFNAFRITLGEDLYTTFEQYKAKIDEAINNKGWIIFKSHSQYTSFDDNQINLIKQIIDYARENKMLEVTLEEGLDLFGNLIDIGDYTARSLGVDYYVLDRKGQIYSNKQAVTYRTITNNGSDISKPISNFDSGLTHEQIYSTKVTGFPENKAGTLETYKAGIEYYSFQMYYPYDSNNVYKRYWLRDTNVWSAFEKINSDFLVTSTKNSLNATTVSEFKNGITKEIVQTVNATGFPENKAGVLETNKINPVGYSYQIYYVYATNRVYKRNYDATANWGAWERIDNTRLNITGKPTVTLDVPGNSFVETTISLPGVTNSDNVVVTPVAGIEQGLMYNAFIPSADNVRIRFYNFTSSTVTTNRPYKIDVIKYN